MSKSDDLDAELSSLSRSELRTYLAAMEDQVLASGNPAAENIVHATRRARERKVSESDVPFRKLLADGENELTLSSSLVRAGLRLGCTPRQREPQLT